MGYSLVVALGMYFSKNLLHFDFLVFFLAAFLLFAINLLFMNAVVHEMSVQCEAVVSSTGTHSIDCGTRGSYVCVCVAIFFIGLKAIVRATLVCLFVCLFSKLINNVTSAACSLFAQFSYEGL